MSAAAASRIARLLCVAVLVLVLASTAWAAPFAYVANYSDNSVTKIDVATNTVAGTIPVGAQPLGVAVTSDGAKVYVGNFGAGSVTVIDAATNTASATIPVGSQPRGLAVTPNGSKVYVSSYNTDTVYVIDTTTNAVAGTISVGVLPFGLAVTPDGSKVYVTNSSDDTVSVIATATDTVAVTIATGTRPNGVAVSPDGLKAYVANNSSNTVTVINTNTNAITATVNVGTNPFSLAVTPDGKKVYVTNAGGDDVSVIATATNAVTTIPAIVQPNGVAVTPDGSKVYAVSVTSNNVSVIDTATDTVATSVAVGSHPINLGQFIGAHAQASPTLGASAAPGSATVGNAVGDVAALAGGATPTGTLTFRLFGPGDTTCASAPVFTSTVTVSGNGSYSSATFTPSAVGTYRWTVAYSGDANNAATSVACGTSGQSVAMAKATPTTTASAAPGSAVIGNAIHDNATLSGGVNPAGTLTFRLFGPGDATCASAPVFTGTVTVSGNGSYSSATFTPSAVGTYRWTVAYSGDANNAAASVACGTSGQSVGITMGDQAIVFGAAPSVTVGGSGTVTATGGASGNPVVFGTTSAASVCTVSAGGTVAGVGAGNCIVTADQAGDANYNAAPQVTQTVAIGQASQTIGFTSAAPGSASVAGATYTPTATATSGLVVALSIDASASTVCTINGGVVSFIGAGTCVIDADQPGDANYIAAPQAQQSFVVAQGSQTIGFVSMPPGNAIVGDSYTVDATATSGLAVVFSIDAASTAGACTISGNIVSFAGAGTCVIDADQAGDANYAAAPQVQQRIVIAARVLATPTPALSTLVLALCAGLLALVGLARIRRT